MERRSHIVELAPDTAMGARKFTHRCIEEGKNATYSRPESVSYAFYILSEKAEIRWPGIFADIADIAAS